MVEVVFAIKSWAFDLSYISTAEFKKTCDMALSHASFIAHFTNLVDNGHIKFRFLALRHITRARKQKTLSLCLVLPKQFVQIFFTERMIMQQTKLKVLLKEIFRDKPPIPEHAIEKEIKQLEERIRCLPDELRVVVNSHYYDEITIQAIAKQSHHSPYKVKKTLRRALVILREKMNPHYYDKANEILYGDHPRRIKF
jgi:DNA-directed RNA polymerase specialized sigma24 family protein